MSSADSLYTEHLLYTQAQYEELSNLTVYTTPAINKPSVKSSGRSQSTWFAAFLMLYGAEMSSNSCSRSLAVPV